MKQAKEMSLEEAFEKLETSIANLEKPDSSLEESFQTYQEGMKLLKYCNDKIDQVEKKVLVMNKNGDTDEF